MTTHLLALSIGPVQEFIAAARRTRDLWFGSHLLSEISKAAAKSVQSRGGTLIFPTAEDAAEDDAAVANIILSELPVSVAPLDASNAARDAAQERWLEFAEQAKSAAGTAIVDAIWNDQVEDAIEFYAAWVALDGDYQAMRRRVMQLLSGRKACRDFLPSQGRAGIPKSSLDGRRETVLRRNIDGKVSGELRLADGEQLCAIGLTRRLGGGSRPYPSVARIAADPWLRGVFASAQNSGEVRQAFEDFKAACGALDVIHALNAEVLRQFASFPYEGTSVYERRHKDLANETGRDETDFAGLSKALNRLTKGKNQGGLGFGEPDPYLAILVADGDHMGKLISHIDTAKDHRKLSGQLAQFAAEACGLIEKNNGVCVFAGGDDVLALLPADKALECARALHEEFGNKLAEFKDEIGNTPTLSVGIALGHFMEPLEDLRAYGLEAEKAAKKATRDSDEKEPFADRNGLAVMVHPRSGVEFGAREQWQDGELSLDKRINKWAELFAARMLPSKLPYDLRKLGEELKGWPSPGAPSEAVKADVMLLLKRKQVKKDIREDLEKRLSMITLPGSLLRLAEEMLVAQWIANVKRQSHGSTAARSEIKEGRE
jgi:CRISPR-associated protein Cmr2